MNTVGIQLRISDLLFAVQKRWKIIVSLTLMGLVFGLLLSGMNYVQSAVEDYQIEGSFIISAVDSQGRYSGNSSAPSRNDITMATELYDTVYYLLRSDRLLSQIINDEQLLGVSASDIRNALSISQYGDTNIITMRLTWDHGDEGLELWETIIQTANTLMSQLMQVGRLRVFNQPEAKLINSRTANIKTWMILPVLGLAAGMGFAVIELMMRPTLINVKDVETVFGLETIGIIPYDSTFFMYRSSILVSDEKASSDVSQSFSAAAYILRNRIGSKEKCHCFYITSATVQEGRTSVAANLAIELSDMEKRTLLIDFDYKNPMLGSLFLNNIDYNRSLNALYRGEITMNDAITPMTGYLDLLPMVMEHNLIYLDGTIVEMINQLKEQYDYIIIDAPPVGKESETLSLNQVASAVLFVARYDTASIPEIQAALEKLDKSGTRVLGCIVNALQTSKNVIMGVGKKETEKKETPAGKKKTQSKSKKKKKKAKKVEKTQDEKQETKENDAALLALINKQKAHEAAGNADGTDLDLPPSMEGAKSPEIFQNAQDIPFTQAASGEESFPQFASRASAETEQAPQNAPIPGPEEVNPEEWPLPPVSVPTEAAQDERVEPLPEPETVSPEDFHQPPASVPTEAPQDERAATLPEPEAVSLEDFPLPPANAPAEAAQDGQSASLPEPEIVNPEEWPQFPESEEVALSRLEPPPVAPQDASPAVPPSKNPQKKHGLFSFLTRKPSKEEKPAKPEKPAKAEKLAKTEKPAKAEKSKTAPVKEKAVAEKKAKPAKKKKAGTGFWGLGIEKKPKTPEPFKDIKPDAAVIKAGRNVFDDLMDDGVSAEPHIKSDAEITEELLRMGLDGTWDQPEDKAGGSSKPASGKSGKKDLFEDI